jgi:hypothetical protein
MQEDVQRLTIALRVLGAIIEYREPEESDVQALRSYARLLKRRAPDESACDGIQDVLKARESVSERFAGEV